jgi:hypothetical protein
MSFVALGLFVSLILGAFAMGVVILLTRGRRRAPLTRGRSERAIEYGAGILGGLSLLLMLMVLRPEVTPASQEAALLGIFVAMPVSSAATWLTGELLAGPTRESWLPLLFAILAAHAGFIGPMVMFPWLDQHVLSAFIDRSDALALSAALLTSFVLGGFASTWAYRRSRKEVVVVS